MKSYARNPQDEAPGEAVEDTLDRIRQRFIEFIAALEAAGEDPYTIAPALFTHAALYLFDNYGDAHGFAGRILAKCVLKYQPPEDSA